MKIGIQTYTVREQMDQDFEGTLRTLREIGYEGAELCQFYGRSGAQIRDIFARTGLTLVSMSFSLDDVCDDCAAKIREVKQTGTRYAVISWLDQARRRGTDRWEQTLQELRQVACVCRENGLQLLYHNHDFEFCKHDGSYDYDQMMQQVPQLYAEPDVGWITAAGLSPVAFLQKYSGRVPLVHAKDIEGRIDFETFQYRTVGEGILDWRAVLSAAQKAGTEWIVLEQDLPDGGRTPMACAEAGYTFLRKINP